MRLVVFNGMGHAMFFDESPGERVPPSKTEREYPPRETFLVRGRRDERAKKHGRFGNERKMMNMFYLEL